MTKKTNKGKDMGDSIEKMVSALEDYLHGQDSEQLKCLFEPVTSGYYYGSDGLRSPLTMTRDPGVP